MQVAQLTALLTWPVTVGTPVLLRVVEDEVQFCRIEDFEDEDSWCVLDVCTAEDLPELERAVKVLGADPAKCLSQFPNCEEY